MNIKRLILAAAITVGATAMSQAQSSDLHGTDFWSRTTIEAGYGLNMPFSPEPSAGEAADYSTFGSLHLGARYQIDGLWSVRGTYEMNKFEHKDNSNYGATFHKVALEAMFDISAATAMESDFGVHAHAGLGIGMFKSETLSDDKVGSVQLGLMPSYKLSENFSVFLDATGVMTISQDYGFDGLPVNGSDNSAMMLTTRIGVAYSF